VSLTVSRVPRLIAYYNLADVRHYLLKFYSIEGYQRWNRENEFSIESDERDSSLESLTLADAARSYPSKCLEALAARLGLDYDKICAQMEQLQARRQQTTARPLKRSANAISSVNGKISMRAHRRPAASTRIRQVNGHCKYRTRQLVFS
jgi:hypothetical protein